MLPNFQNRTNINPGSRSWNRLFIALGLIVLLVVLGEVGYYVYLRYYQPQEQVEEQAENQRPFGASPSPGTAVEPQDLDILSNEVSVEKIRLFADNMESLESGFFVSNTIRTVYKGTLLEVVEEPTEVAGTTYVMAIRMLNENEDGLAISLTQEEKDNMEVVLNDQNGTKKISYKEIQEGDEIIITVVRNLLDHRLGVATVSIDVRRGVGVGI
jgi:hypothetical protein